MIDKGLILGVGQLKIEGQSGYAKFQVSNATIANGESLHNIFSLHDTRM